MRMRVVAIAAAVILVVAFVVAAIPCGAVIGFNNVFLDRLSRSSLLDDGIYTGVRSTNDTNPVFNGRRLYGNSGMISPESGVVAWCLIEQKMMQPWETVWFFDNSDSDATPPYPSYAVGLLQSNFVNLYGVDFDLYACVFTPDEWQTMIGGELQPNYASFDMDYTLAVSESVDFAYYVGLNTVSDFYAAAFDAGRAVQGDGAYRGIYAGADWTLRINLNVTYEGDAFWQTDIYPEVRDGYIDVDTAYTAALERFYADTNLGGLNIESILVQCDFYSPYELGLGLIQTSGSVDSSIALELLTVNGNPYTMNAIEDGGWVKWDNSNVSRLKQFASFRYLVPIAYAHDSLRFYVAGAEFDAGYNVGYDDGFSNGADVGYAAGEETGYVDGKQDGLQEGFGNGYTEGVSVGKELGYSTGYSEGLQVAENGNFYSLISAVVDAPIQAFLGLLTFEFLGVNLANFFLSIVSAFFALKIYKIIKSVK